MRSMVKLKYCPPTEVKEMVDVILDHLGFQHINFPHIKLEAINIINYDVWCRCEFTVWLFDDFSAITEKCLPL